MISKDTYKILKKIPRYPDEIPFKELESMHLTNVSLLVKTLEDSSDCSYIVVSGRNATSITHTRYHLTEAGQIAIEEYKNRFFTAIKSTSALAVAVLSLIVAIIALFRQT